MWKTILNKYCCIISVVLIWLLNCKVVINIIKNSLNKMIEILNSIKGDKQYSNDNILICDLIQRINSILNNDNITNDFLDKMDYDSNYLDQKYDDLFDLINLFDPICFELKKNEDEFIFHLLFVLNIVLLALGII